MANKKKKSTANTAENKPAAQKLSKKERRAQEEARLQALKAKRKKYYGAAMLVAVLAVILSFTPSTTYGTEIYMWIQIACYGLLGLCGFILLRGSRYEETTKRGNRMNSMGMVFMMVAAAMILTQIVQWIRS